MESFSCSSRGARPEGATTTTWEERGVKRNEFSQVQKKKKEIVAAKAASLEAFTHIRMPPRFSFGRVAQNPCNLRPLQRKTKHVTETELRGPPRQVGHLVLLTRKVCSIPLFIFIPTYSLVCLCFYFHIHRPALPTSPQRSSMDFREALASVNIT